MDEALAIDLARARFFPDAEIITASYQRSDPEMQPPYVTFCANPQELALARALAPRLIDVRFILPEDLRPEAEKIIDQQLEDIEVIYRQHRSGARPTPVYEDAKEELRQELLKLLQEQSEVES